mgnify:CR=1 FL=1
MYNLSDLFSCCHELIENANKSAKEFANDDMHDLSDLSIEAANACRLIVNNDDHNISMMAALSNGVEICEKCAEECEKHPSIKSFRTAIVCHKCANIARSLYMMGKRAA